MANANAQVVAFSPLGDELWMSPPEPHPSASNWGIPGLAIGPNETIYALELISERPLDKFLHAIRNGERLASTRAENVPVIAADGTVYVDNLKSLSPMLETNWVKSIGYPVAVDWSNSLVCWNNTNVFVVSPAGEISATLPLDSTPKSIVLTQAGNILIAGASVYLYRPTGELLRKASALGAPLQAKEGGEYYLYRTKYTPSNADDEAKYTLYLDSFTPAGLLEWSYELAFRFEALEVRSLAFGGEGRIAFLHHGFDPFDSTLDIVVGDAPPARSPWFSGNANGQNTRWAEPPVRTLETTGQGSGHISRSPEASEYDLNASVTITATPDAGATFLRWQGDITSTENPVTVRMETHKKIIAVFSEAPGAVQLSATREEDQLRLQAIGSSSGTYELEQSSDLSSWSVVQQFQSSLDLLIPTTGDYRFYRVISKWG